MQRWEYLIHKVDQFTFESKTERAQSELQRLGSEGWELVSVKLGGGPGADYLLVFKRPKAAGR